MRIDIAIIDSGINPAHPHVQGVAGGLTFDLDPDGRPMATEGFDDRIGHGTAIAGIFRETLPLARIWAVKIFQSDLTASSASLLAALEWAIDKDIKIIHLSLGTEREQDRQSLERLCRTADEKGLVIMAAARGFEDNIYPAVFKSVIGVYWNKACRPGTIVFHPNNPIEFGAWGHPRPLPGLDQKHNFCGSSFAVAHVSVMAARILISDRNADSTTVKQKLTRNAENGHSGGELPCASLPGYSNPNE